MIRSVFRGKLCSMTLLTLKVYIDQVEDVETLSRLVDETALRLYEVKIRTREHRLRMVLENVDFFGEGRSLMRERFIAMRTGSNT
jgi:hypothetical protein